MDVDVDVADLIRGLMSTGRLFNGFLRTLSLLLPSPPLLSLQVTCSSDKTVKLWNLNNDRLDETDPVHAHVDPAVPSASDVQAAGAASTNVSEPAMAAENPDVAPAAPQTPGDDPRVPPSAARPPPAPGGGSGGGGSAGAATGSEGVGVGVGGGLSMPVMAPGGGPAGFPLEKTLTSHQRWVWDACFSADSAYLVTVITITITHPLTRPLVHPPTRAR